MGYTVGRIVPLSLGGDPWDALDSIRERVAVEPRPPNSFTTAEYAKRYAMNAWSAERQLRRLVERGDLYSRPAIVNGRRVNVFWIPVVERPKACQSSTKSPNGRHGKKESQIGG